LEGKEWWRVTRKRTTQKTKTTKSNHKKKNLFWCGDRDCLFVFNQEKRKKEKVTFRNVIQKKRNEK